ncbi:unnamed protein product [Prunus armeniaca]|uniref:Uncharacterized protein n=1 Tax=Prunus armeniaca TaxID=36596 RepID=A0A6J5WVB1_PRUAR|nr:unnamed protein product [Prunus armeniaca]
MAHGTLGGLLTGANNGSPSFLLSVDFSLSYSFFTASPPKPPPHPPAKTQSNHHVWPKEAKDSPLDHRLDGSQARFSAASQRAGLSHRREGTGNFWAVRKNQRMTPVPLSQCNSTIVGLLRYWIRFGKTKVNLQCCSLWAA